VFYAPQKFDVATKRKLVSDAANPLELGGSPDDVSNQFFNELTKRSPPTFQMMIFVGHAYSQLRFILLAGSLGGQSALKLVALTS
jgi:hypothetical protein